MFRALVLRCPSASAGNGAPKRRLWRWGATKKSPLGPEVVERSKLPTPVEVTGVVNSAACGSDHAAIVVDGKLFTFGSNKYNQLGRLAEPKTDEPGGPVEFDAQMPGISCMDMGGYHSAVVSEGKLWTWGWSGSFWYGSGALGYEGTGQQETPKLVERLVEDGIEVKQVACGHQHTMVLTTDNKLYSCGKGEFGRLGHGGTSDEPEFQELDYFDQAEDSILDDGKPPNIIKVGCGNNFSAALSSEGELWVWGRNDYGQLGLGEEAMGDMYSAETYPRLVRSLPMRDVRITDFVCGEHHVVVISDDGSIFEWGARNWLEPHQVCKGGSEKALPPIKQLFAGDKFSGALTQEGRLYTWGHKSSGCLARQEEKTTMEPTLVPQSMFEHQAVLSVAAKKFRCLAITEEGSYVE